MQHTTLTPSEIGNLEWYRFIEYQKHLEKYLKNKNEAYDDAKKQQASQSQSQMKPKMPKFNAPKLKR